MNKETYEALKRLAYIIRYGGSHNKMFWEDLQQVESWIDEVSKEYEEGGEQE